MQGHTRISLSAEEVNIPVGRMGQLPIIAGVVGIAGIAASFLLAADQAQFWFSYLVALCFFLSIGLGGLFFVLLQFATRAGWSVVVRRLAENVMGTLPVLGLLLVGVIPGIHDLYHWSHSDAVASDPLLQHKSPYLNSSFFSLRLVVYAVSWSLIAWWFRGQSLKQDHSGDPAITRKLQSLSAPALVWFGVTLTLAAFDLIMSLDPHWYSTIFGVYFFAGSTISILATTVLMVLWSHRLGLLRNVITFEHFQDLGKLLFGFVVFWAYIGFSQFMLIWYGNIPEETAWYKHRMEEGWMTVTIALAVGHFVFPFFLLLFKDVKRHRLGLSLAAVWLLAMHYLDLYWLIMPAHGGFHPGLTDITCLVGIGGLFIATLGLLSRRPALVPIHDPRLAESMSFENI